jgi:hypothetical protein
MNEEMDRQETALVPVNGAVQRDFRAGTAALSEMPQSEFDQRLASMARGRDRLRQIHNELMTAETDYGVIPGTGKPTLLKPGAEKLLHFYRLCAEFLPEISRGDGANEPYLEVVTECRAHVGDIEGPVVATGHGAANSWEKRYRRGGQDSAAAYDMLNTLIKMAAKRAMVDCALRATATSGVYSQDMEDLASQDASGARQPVNPAPPASKSGRSREAPPKAVESPRSSPGAEDEPPHEFQVCDVDDCGQILSDDERLGCVKNAERLGGRWLCSAHGKALIAEAKALAAARVEAADPFANES